MRQLSLDTKGTKQELVDRLHAYLAAQEVSFQTQTLPAALIWRHCWRLADCQYDGPLSNNS